MILPGEMDAASKLASELWQSEFAAEGAQAACSYKSLSCLACSIATARSQALGAFIGAFLSWTSFGTRLFDLVSGAGIVGRGVDGVADGAGRREGGPRFSHNWSKDWPSSEGTFAAPRA
jgi:hypothetical protein